MGTKSKFDRRNFFKAGASFLTISMVACSENNTLGFDAYKPSEFSSDRFHQKLDVLAALYGDEVKRNLLPGLNRQEILKKCKWFPGEVPDEIISLYSWSAGQKPDTQPDEADFWFRDNIFIDVSSVQWVYESLMRSYGTDASNHEFLKYSFPFAASNGGFYILPTKDHPFSKVVQRPIISVFEGIDLFYYSIETMVDTCIDWVSHPLYFGNFGLPRNVELSIWEKHNPGIFNQYR